MKSQLIAPTNFTMTTHNPIKAKRLIDVSVFYGNKIYFSIFVTLFASFFFRSTSYFMLLMVDYKIGADIPTLTAHLSYGKKPFLFELTDYKPLLRKKMRSRCKTAQFPYFKVAFMIFHLSLFLAFVVIRRRPLKYIGN